MKGLGYATSPLAETNSLRSIRKLYLAEQIYPLVHCFVLSKGNIHLSGGPLGQSTAV